MLTMTIKRLFALGAAAALLFTFAACGDNGNDPTTDPAITTTEQAPDTLDAHASGSDPETTTSVDGSTTEVASTTEGSTQSTKPGESATAATTSAPAANKAPSTKAEIIDYVNNTMKAVRQAKPGYTMTERTHIDDTRVSSESSFIDSVAPPIIKSFKSSFDKWSDPKVTAKGASHAELMPKVDIQPAWVKSATCNESNGVYNIRINFVDERVAKLPPRKTDTMHGKVMTCFDQPQITEGAGDSIDMRNFDTLYSGSYLTLTIDKATGKVKTIISFVDGQVELTVKVPVVPVLSASIPIGPETKFVLNAY